jgi:multidrug resistance efflux pump
MRAGPTPEEADEAEQRLKAREAALAEAKAAAKELPTLEADMVIRRAELRETQAAARLAQAQQADLAVIEERVKTAEAELQRAQAEVSGRAAALASTTITAPLDGTVTRTYDEVGETCRRGVPTILIADDSKPRWIEAFVREQDAMLVTPGQRARVKVPANGGWYVEAVVVFVGLHTQSLDHVGGAGASDGARTTQQPERVWVRLQPSKPLRGNPVPGTSARAVIRVR